MIYANRVVRTYLDLQAMNKTNVLLRLMSSSAAGRHNVPRHPCRTCDAILSNEAQVISPSPRRNLNKDIAMILDGLSPSPARQTAPPVALPGAQTDAPTTGTQAASNIIDLGVTSGIPSSANGGGARDIGVGDDPR